jgi:predicted ribosome quality control (RQC) complex YloA/Tae2 family protein
MHNNYYFLRQISSSLQKVLTGTVISECYSQTKDEVIFRFETHSNPFYLRANLGASLSAVSFPVVTERAKKNSIDLFPGTIGFRVVAIKQYENERSFSIALDEGKTLLFKMHGNRSNVILFDQNNASDLFRTNLPGDMDINPLSLDRSIDWSFETFVQHHHEPEKLYFTFGKIAWLYLKERGYQSLPVESKWSLIWEVISMLKNPEYYFIPVKDVLHLSLLPLAGAQKIEGDPLDVANRFFYAFTQEYVIEREKQNAIGILKNKLSGSLNYYEKNFQKLTEIENDSNYKQWADLVMAHMHNIRQGEETVSLPDFYQEGHVIDIKLKKELSPQANAAIFYRKAKNQHIEIERLQQSLELKEKEIQKIKESISEIQVIDDLKELRKKIIQLGLAADKEKQVPPLPYHEFMMSGYRIWVGKNAQGNDELTLKYAYKEDLWLHAKDVAGSHVIIKFQSGKTIPKEVIERAAELAAFNSKRKNESLCPVIVTPKKFVRKRKGDPAGAVIVEREEVIMVEPKL